MNLPKTTENISISLPSWLLEEFDNYCDKDDFTRSKFIARATRKYILSKYDSPEIWEELYKKHHQM